MIRQLHADDRGVSTLVNHTLAIGITGLLIVGLLTAGTSYLEDQQQFAAQDGLETVGNELAGDVTQLLRLSTGDAKATITTNLPERIAGRSYSAEVRDGTACDRLESVPKSCLVLSLASLDTTRHVPLSMEETALELNRLGAGRFRLDYVGGPTGEASADSDVTQLSLRVGIGDDVTQERGGQDIVGRTNLPPTNVSFELDPEWPSTGRTITFTAEAVDPDATDPANPDMNYSWDFDGDGTFEAENLTTDTVTHSYSSYGRKNVTLRVTDERSASTWESKNISISGLEYVDGSLNTDNSDFGGQNVSFEMENTHSRDIEIVGLFFKPVDGADRIVAEDSDCGFLCRDYNYEILFDTNDDGFWDDAHDFEGSPWESTNDGEEISETGLSVSATYGLGGQNLMDAAVNSGDTVRIRFNGVEGIVTEEYIIGVKYRFDGTDVTNTTRFDTGNVP